MQQTLCMERAAVELRLTCYRSGLVRSQRHAPDDACKSLRSHSIQAELALCLGAKRRIGRESPSANVRSTGQDDEAARGSNEQVVWCATVLSRSSKSVRDAGIAVSCRPLHAAPVAGDACAVTFRCLHARNQHYVC